MANEANTELLALVKDTTVDIDMQHLVQVLTLQITYPDEHVRLANIIISKEERNREMEQLCDILLFCLFETCITFD